MQRLDPKDWRIITYEGQAMPQSLMGISILINADEISEETKDWLWRLVNCRGVTKHMNAMVCLRAAEQTRDYLLTATKHVLCEINRRLSPCGFDSNMTYAEWMTSLTMIIDATRTTSGDCHWSAPSHTDDPYSGREGAMRLLNSIDRLARKNDLDLDGK